jgi:hypothetical protein
MAFRGFASYVAVQGAADTRKGTLGITSSSRAMLIRWRSRRKESGIISTIGQLNIAIHRTLTPILNLEYSYVHRLIQNRSDGRLVELPSAKAVKRQDHTATPHLGRLHATVVAEGLGPTASDEKRMAQLEHISLEFSSLASIQLEEQKERHDAEVRDLHEQLRSSKQKLAEGEQWRKKYILVEDQRKALETKTVPELQKAQSQAESKTEKVCAIAT